MDTIDDGTFTLSLSPGIVGVRGCAGNEGSCPYQAEYEVTLAYCDECEETHRTCRYFKHRMNHPDSAYVCGVCLVRLRPWNVLTAIACVAPDPGPPPQIVV